MIVRELLNPAGWQGLHAPGPASSGAEHMFPGGTQTQGYVYVVRTSSSWSRRPTQARSAFRQTAPVTLPLADQAEGF